MTDEPHTFVIPGELYSSKNSRLPVIYQDKSGKTIKKVIKSAAARRQQLELLHLFAGNPAFCDAFRREAQARELPLRLHVSIYRRTAARFDYNNICQNLFDCMVHAGLLVDDCADQLLPIYKPYEIDANHPRVELRVLNK
jgi:hypothetical protein